MRVLVLDNTALTRSLLSRAIKDMGEIKGVGLLEVDLAASIDIAAMKIEQESYGVVFVNQVFDQSSDVDKYSVFKSKLSSKIRLAGFCIDQCSEAIKPDILLPDVDLNDSPGTVLKWSQIIFKWCSRFLAEFSFEPTGTASSENVSSTEAKLDTGPVQLKRDLARDRSFVEKSLLESPPDLILIASSTGGPAALEVFFSSLSANLSVPILIAQHMPPVFTQILANRLSQLSGRAVQESKSGEPIVPGMTKICPGDFHMYLQQRKSGDLFVYLNQEPPRNSVRPSADVLFESASRVQNKRILSIVLTGMGEDGAQGAKSLFESGQLVLIQDEASCVVYGMPKAVSSLGAFHLQTSIPEMTELLNSIRSLRSVS